MLVPGFNFAATAAGIKKTGVLDLALLVADAPAAAAGVFTPTGSRPPRSCSPGSACGPASPRPSW